MALSIQKIQTSIRRHFEKQRNPNQHVAIGEEADCILYSFEFSDNDSKKYNTGPRITLFIEETLSMTEETLSMTEEV